MRSSRDRYRAAGHGATSMQVVRDHAAPPGGPEPAGAGAVDFAESVRLVSFAAKSNDLSVPVFRSPPRIPGIDRSLARTPTGQPVVSVRLADRPVPAVQADLIDAVLHVNKCSSDQARRFRASAWEALTAIEAEPGTETVRQIDPTPRIVGDEPGGPRSESSSGSPRVA